MEGYLEGARPRGVIFPDEAVTAVLMERIAGRQDPTFALIVTDYFGGVGDQAGRLYRGRSLPDPSLDSINDVLRALGVVAQGELDEFDTVGLGRIRSQPDYLDRYPDLAEELGV